jgi:hypothetical protein
VALVNIEDVTSDFSDEGLHKFIAGKWRMINTPVHRCLVWEQSLFVEIIKDLV